MRIAIDLSRAGLAGIQTAGLNPCVRLAKAMVGAGTEHTFFVVVSDEDPALVPALRSMMAGTLPAWGVRSWHWPARTAGSGRGDQRHDQWASSAAALFKRGLLADLAVGLVLMPVATATREALDAQVEPAVRVFAEPVQKIESGDHLTPAAQPWALAMQCMGGQWCIDIPAAGSYVLFCEHDPAEFGLQLMQAPAVTRAFASHHHDQAISSIGISDPRPLDARKVNDWLSYLLQNRGEDLLRMKGVLNLRGETRRYVFHAVHMMFDGRPERDWGDAPRNSSVVFIGRNLDRAELEAGFESCIA